MRESFKFARMVFTYLSLYLYVIKQDGKKEVAQENP